MRYLTICIFYSGKLNLLLIFCVENVSKCHKWVDRKRGTGEGSMVVGKETEMLKSKDREEDKDVQHKNFTI